MPIIDSVEALHLLFRFELTNSFNRTKKKKKKKPKKKKDKKRKKYKLT